MLKAISLWNPFAMLIALGIKRNETRGWKSSHRGEIAIHAAQRCENESLGRFWKNMVMADPKIGDVPFREWGGKILCVVNLLVPWSTDDRERVNALSVLEVEAGNYEPGRYVWPCDNLRRLTKPVPCVGRQRIWTLSAEVETQVRANLGVDTY